jgi:hypothetical protein
MLEKEKQKNNGIFNRAFLSGIPVASCSLPCIRVMSLMMSKLNRYLQLIVLLLLEAVLSGVLHAAY